MKKIVQEFVQRKLSYFADEFSLTKFSHNFGGSFLLPLIVVEPRNRLDIIEIVKIANKYKLALAVKGFGHAAGKQNEVTNGILINIRTLNHIRGISINKEGIPLMDVDAGVSWRELLDYCLNYQLIPYIFTDWLELTVGGTISLGGIGASSFLYGLQADHVQDASIVSNPGRLYKVDKDNYPHLFNAAKSGLGQFGIFTDFKIPLRKSPQKVILHKLVFTDINEFFKESFAVLQTKKVDAIIAHFECNLAHVIKDRMGIHYEKFSQNTLPKTKWLAILELSEFIYSKNQRLLEEPNYFSEHYEVKDYLSRLPPILSSTLEKKYTKHTECTLLIPFNKNAVELVCHLLEQLSHELLGFGTILFVPMKRSVIKSRFFIRPIAEDFFLLGILARDMKEEIKEQSLSIILQFYNKALSLGARRYPCDSMVTVNWKDHFGDDWEEFIALKNEFDPDGLFSPGLSILS
jgi:hypothetical protein